MPESTATSSTSPTLSIVIPAYNEAARLGATLSHLREYAGATGTPCELIIVDDGSTDGTGDLVRRFMEENRGGPLEIQLLVNPANRGKGYSVKRGMLAARGGLLLMCDADLSTPIEELEKLRKWLASGAGEEEKRAQFEIVIGSRDLPGSHLDPPQPLLRRWMAWTFRAVRRRVLLHELRDTQCGFKLFTRAAAQAVFSRQTVDGWLFDCEVLAMADRLGLGIKEVGVVWRNHPHSRVSPLREMFASLPTLWTIRRRIRRM